MMRQLDRPRVDARRALRRSTRRARGSRRTASAVVARIGAASGIIPRPRRRLRQRVDAARRTGPAVPAADETVGTIRQQRGHLSPSARATPTSIVHASRQSVAAGACGLERRPRDTMNSIGSVVGVAFEQRGGAPRSSTSMTTCACSELPIVFCFAQRFELALTADRASSSSCPTARSSAGVAHRVESAAAGTRRGAPTSSRVPGRWRHSSSVGDRQDRRQQPHQAVGDDVHRRLRRAPLGRAGRERVEPILRDVGVERAQIDGRELVDRLEDRRVVVARRTPRRPSAPPSA